MSFDKTYVGLTKNIEKRLSEHNSGKSHFTKSFKPWILIYKEVCDNMTDARKREKYFKSASGRKFLRKLVEA